MKIISLIGSPHGEKGNTAALLDRVHEGAMEKGASIETILLKGDTVFPCLACDACHKKGKCVQKDDFERIREKIEQAEGLILASPNYIFSVSAQLKAFMDRCCSVVHLMGFEGKYGASVITSGGGDESAIAEYMNHFLLITGVRPVGSVWATMGLLTDNRFTDDIRQSARMLGNNLVRAWKTGAMDPAVEQAMSSFRERMYRLVQWRKTEWPYEYEYWRNHRGME
ncbi:MAG: NAD(P)H-dependent oxidoreductase [Desulfobacterales bacterium]